MNNNVLKSAITAVIKQNGNEEITGDILQQTLIAMVDALGGNYQFAGVATSATNPGTPDQHVFYLAAEAGTAVYTNFGGIAVDKEICALCFVTSWTKMSLVSFDEEPTEDSGNLVSSGAIYQALENLASYVEDAFMPKVPTAVENNIATFDGAGKVKDSGKSLAAFLPADGIAMASGLIDVISAGTDQEFLYRKSGGDGVAFYKGIKGKSIVWNQLIPNGDFSDGTTGWGFWNGSGTLSASDNVLTVTAASVGGGAIRVYPTVGAAITTGHKYIARFLMKSSLESGSGYFQLGGVGVSGEVTTTWKEFSFVVEATNTNPLIIGLRSANEGDVFYLANVEVTDLTLGNMASLTAAQFNALYHGYHAYNPGIIKNNDADGIATDGFNQWDEECEAGNISFSTGQNIADTSFVRSKNYIPIFPSTLYYFKKVTGALTYVFYYDAEKNYLGYADPFFTVGSGGTFTTIDNAVFMRFCYIGTTYNHDICINLSDPDRNGEYEPYWKKDIQLNLPAFDVEDAGGNVQVVNGLGGQGPDFDEIVNGKDYYRRRTRINLGSLGWNTDWWATDGRLYVNLPAKAIGRMNIMYPLGPTVDGDNQIINKIGITGNDSNHYIYIGDAKTHASAEAFIASLDGIYAEFTLATEEHYTLVDPITQYLQVDEDGTEKAIAPSAATTPSAPFVAQTTYTISIPNLVKKIATI